MVANVSRCVTGLSSVFDGVSFLIGFALSLVRVPGRDGPVRGLCIVTNLDVLIICLIPSFQLVHALLMKRRALGVRGIRVSSIGGGIVAQ